MTREIIALLTLITVVLAVTGLFRLLTGTRRRVVERLQDISVVLHGDEPAEKSPPNLRDTFRIFSSRVASPVSRTGWLKKIEQELARADLLLKGEEFVIITLVLAAIGLLAGFLTGNLGLGLLLAVLGLMGPWTAVRRAQAKRLVKIDSQVGDALTVMANSLRAGFSFLQAMDMVSKEMPPPLAKEFSRSLRETSLGTPLDDALLQLGRRVGSQDLDLVVTAVLIQRQVGGNLAEVMDSIGETIRERIRIKGEIKTLTAQGRISGWIIGLLPVALAAFLLALNPEYIAILVNNPVGRLMVGAGVTAEIMGIFVIRKIVQIEV